MKALASCWAHPAPSYECGQQFFNCAPHSIARARPGGREPLPWAEAPRGGFSPSQNDVTTLALTHATCGWACSTSIPDGRGAPDNWDQAALRQQPAPPDFRFRMPDFCSLLRAQFRSLSKECSPVGLAHGHERVVHLAQSLMTVAPGAAGEHSRHHLTGPEAIVVCTTGETPFSELIVDCATVVGSEVPACLTRRLVEGKERTTIEREDDTAEPDAA